ncbi:MAG: aminotransferase class I/II-fold pyridoxal phosphate-dependent enzyme [Pseudomonadota bacterium]
MPHDRLKAALRKHVEDIEATGNPKSRERVIREVSPPRDGKGPRLLLDGEGDRPFLRMNANNYLGLSTNAQMIAAEEEAVRAFGVGPGAVRFISGTMGPHTELERRLAAFHNREAVMIFSSAYMAILGSLVPLVTKETAVISDALNHNCIINAIRLANPSEKRIYAHNDLSALEEHLQSVRGKCRRALIVTDGVFSMRGDFAPLPEVMALAEKYDPEFEENVIVFVDDSHGAGAFGRTGRGTEEVTGSSRSDVLVATLGKAFGVNGGYVAGPQALVDYLRETAANYIYSNPITPGEAAAAIKAVEIVDSPEGIEMLAHLSAMTARFEDGLANMGLETIAGPHPVTPLMVRNTPRTKALVESLYSQGVLSTGLSYPVVPQGDESIRFQISAEHTPTDIDEALAAVKTAVAQN